MGEKTGERPGIGTKGCKPNVAMATLRFLEALEKYMRATKAISAQGAVMRSVSKDLSSRAASLDRCASRFRIR